MKKIFLCEDSFQTVKHTIPRKEDLDLNIDLESLEDKLIDDLHCRGWIRDFKEDEKSIHIVFKKCYDEENTFSLWGYYIKHPKKYLNS